MSLTHFYTSPPYSVWLFRESKRSWCVTSAVNSLINSCSYLFIEGKLEMKLLYWVSSGCLTLGGWIMDMGQEVAHAPDHTLLSLHLLISLM